MKNLFAAFEEENSGTTEREVERVFYADVTAEFLNLAYKKEDQEQWQLRIEKPATATSPAVSGRFRVRKTMRADGVTYTQAFKISNPESIVGFQDSAETEQIISESTFEAAKSLCCEGMIKRRHFIKLSSEPDAEEIEVDAFFLPDGELANWVKIDYNTKPGQIEVPEFPKGIVSLIDGTTDIPEDRAHIRNLYDELFISKR